MENPIIVIKLEDGRKITLELYPEVAPITVENFLKLVDQKYFDGVCFHRVIENFMIQTGGYYLDGNSLNEKADIPSIKGEFEANGVENNLAHKLGVISMARTNDMNSASSQFFICSADAPHLDGNYAAFGKTVDEESNQVVLEISKVPTMNIGYGFSDFPQFPVVIESIRRG
ncbi:MAG: peptidylprolyl isomerase [Bacilli bacterium]|nr:peptidylprolyl isomerase [Bacilli bacterium]